MPTKISGVPPSTEIRDLLRKEDRPMLIAFSRGKDSIAAWCALLDAGIPQKNIIPYFMYSPPGLTFVDESVAYFEDHFGVRIMQLPHPSLYRKIRHMVFQPPERLAIIEALDLPDIDYVDVLAAVKKQHGLPADTWVADGVRAADSIQRRASIGSHGAMKRSNHKVSPIWDWLKAEVMGTIADHGIIMPVDYEMFDRSYDGIDYRFLSKIRDRFPDDYQKILDWFPLAELEIFRHESIGL